MNFIDLSYYYNRTGEPHELLKAHAPNLGYLEYMPANWNCSVIKFSNWQGEVTNNRTRFYFFNGSASRLWFPLSANRFIAGLKPDVVMLHGLIFPQQLLLLKRSLSKHTKIIVQHHAELPGKGIMRKFQQLADKYVNGYLFATAELAVPWIEEGIIKQEKVFEVMEGSSVMQRMDKQAARNYLALPDGPVFLWVGHLNNNKDPLTVLRAFDDYLQKEPGAKLYMVYQSDELRSIDSGVSMVEQIVNQSASLRNDVVLKGRLERDELAYWYNAADYFISGSRSEGSGYALIEAMSCGCIPVVTDIPSFRKITDNGKLGFLFKPGNVPSLSDILFKVKNAPKEELKQRILTHFANELSFKAIARQIIMVCDKLTKL